MLPLHIDLETRSAADLTKVGVHRYAEDPTTSIICGGYRFGNEPVKLWLGETPPSEVREHIAKGGPLIGHNQQFERILLNARLKLDVQPENQDCTMARAAAVGLPHALFGVGKALRLDQAKDIDGHRLMMQMCKPRTTEPLTWHEQPEAVHRLAAYCAQDVETETDADGHLPHLSARERRVWQLDQRINDRGFAVDLPLVQAAHGAVLEAQRRADDAMWRITGGAIKKASQAKRIAEWVESRGVPCTSIADPEIDDLLIGADMLDDQAVIDALKLRRASAGAFKFEAMLRAVCADGRIRGSLQYHGTHGGRWAGRVVQPQNFKRIDSDEEGEQVALTLDILRRFPAPGDALNAMEMLLDIPPLEALSLCARPMIVARPGHRLLDADFSNVEGRVNAWFAGEDWKLDAFRAFDRGEGPDLYRVTAATVLDKDVADIRREERQESGKVPELACGYQGGWRALQKQAAKIGLVLARGRAGQIVDGWRAVHPAIVESWAELQQAAIDAVRAPGMMVPALGGKVRYLKPTDTDFLWCCLPSGRVISYASPVCGWRTKYFDEDGQMVTLADVRAMSPERRANVDEANNYGVTFWGQKSGRWIKLDLYGGMQCAHIVSGTARDLLVEAMFATEAAGYETILTVHDEVLCETPSSGEANLLEDFKARFVGSKPAWIGDMPLVASAWEDVRYSK